MFEKTQKHTFALFFPELSYWHKAPIGSQITLTQEAIVNRIGRVLRLKTNDQVMLFNDLHLLHGNIQEISRSSVKLRVDSIAKTPRPNTNTWLLAGMLQKKAWEELLYFAAELGVTHLVPIATAKTQADWSNSANEQQRWQNIIIAAREQAKSFYPITLHAPTQLQAIDTLGLEFAANENLAIFVEPNYPSLPQILCNRLKKDEPPANNIALLVGPEGGLTAQEQEWIQTQGFMGAGLTSTILRAPEAALLAMGTILSFKF